jgi:transposase
VRRRSCELAAAGPAPTAAKALECIAELYAIEAEIRGRDVAMRRAARCERSRPIVDSFKT